VIVLCFEGAKQETHWKSSNIYIYPFMNALARTLEPIFPIQERGPLSACHWLFFCQLFLSTPSHTGIMITPSLPGSQHPFIYMKADHWPKMMVPVTMFLDALWGIY